MKVCPKCNGINDDKAESCRSCGNKFYQNLTIRCPNCGRLCSLDKKWCPNCGAKLPAKDKPQTTLASYPKSWLGDKSLLIKLGVVLLVLVGIFCVAASLRSSTYLYHASSSIKVQINYQDGNHQPLFSEYYDLRPLTTNYANYFGGKESFWRKNRSFKNIAYYYGKNTAGYDRIWKKDDGKPLERYTLIQHIKANHNSFEIKKSNHKAAIIFISNQQDPVRFINEYKDNGKCTFAGEPQIRYYQLNTLSQY